jgi:hypothetical protein
MSSNDHLFDPWAHLILPGLLFQGKVCRSWVRVLRVPDIARQGQILSQPEQEVQKKLHVVQKKLCGLVLYCTVNHNVLYCNYYLKGLDLTR